MAEMIRNYFTPGWRTDRLHCVCGWEGTSANMQMELHEEVTDYTTENITGAVKATDGSLAIKAEEKGFDGGILSVIIGFDTNGTVTGIWVDASTQTKGIGSNVATDSFLAQFDGMDGTQNITLGQGYDAYSGATISSKALFAAINDCINCYNELA